VNNYYPDWIDALITGVTIGLSIFVATKIWRRGKQAWIIGVVIGVVMSIVLRSVLRRFGI
jgi:uncharacterized membrane protein (UPF0136 family)